MEAPAARTDQELPDSPGQVPAPGRALRRKALVVMVVPDQHDVAPCRTPVEGRRVLPGELVPDVNRGDASSRACTSRSGQRGRPGATAPVPTRSRSSRTSSSSSARSDARRRGRSCSSPCPAPPPPRRSSRRADPPRRRRRQARRPGPTAWPTVPSGPPPVLEIRASRRRAAARARSRSSREGVAHEPGTGGRGRLRLCKRHGIGNVEVQVRGPGEHHSGIALEQRHRSVVLTLDLERSLQRWRAPEADLRRPAQELSRDRACIPSVGGLGRPVEAGRDHDLSHPGCNAKRPASRNPMGSGVLAVRSDAIPPNDRIDP